MKKLMFEKLESKIEKNEDVVRGLILAKRQFKGPHNAEMRRNLKQTAAMLIEENINHANVINGYGNVVKEDAIDYVKQFEGQHLERKQQEEIVMHLREMFGTTRPSFKTKKKGFTQWMKKLGFNCVGISNTEVDFKNQWISYVIGR